MNKVLLLKRAACSSALLSLVACGSSNSGSPSSSSSVSSVAESSSVAVAVSSAEESSSEAASSVVVVTSSTADSSSAAEASSEPSSSSVAVVASSSEMSSEAESSSSEMSSEAESSSSEMSSEAESSSSAPATANLLPDPSFESGTLNGDYWQTDAAAISTDAAYVTDGASGVNIDTVDSLSDPDIQPNYIETTFPADTLSSGSLYFFGADARADAGATWANWNVSLFADGQAEAVAFRTFNQLGIGGTFDNTKWYERAVAFTAPESIIGIETTLRIQGAPTGAIDNTRMQKIDTFIANYDFEDGDVSKFVVSDNVTLGTNTDQAISGSTSLSFTPSAKFGYIELPLEKGVIQSGKRYVVTMNFGTATANTNGNPYLVHLIDTVSLATIGKDGFNYAYYAGTGANLSAAFILDVDRDQSSDVDWAASENIALRASDIWGAENIELLIDNLTISEIVE